MEEALKAIIVRICIGIIFGSFLVSIFFSIWGIVTYGSGPVIGTLVFETIGFAVSCFLMYEMVYKALKTQQDDAILL